MDKEHQLVELSSAVMQTQIVILAGLINQKVVDAVAMRDWIQACIDDLKPEERERAYGRCMRQVVFALEKNAIPRPPAH
ncbi:MAG: hypothetical protein FD144_1992 [Rhodospirillaceae bacterium]|nr:MAG: hypothetical protein FD144_1992 [Rhodospirillaceae bacterium]